MKPTQEQPTRAMRIKMTDADGNVFWWTVKRETRPSEWYFTDHEGYKRFGGINWLALVDTFRLVAGNYGFSTNIS